MLFLAFLSAGAFVETSAGCFCRWTERRRSITGEGQRDVAWRVVTVEGPRDVVVLMETDRAESRSWQALVDYFPTICLRRRIVLATIWPLIKILRSPVSFSAVQQYHSMGEFLECGTPKFARGHVWRTVTTLLSPVLECSLREFNVQNSHWHMFLKTILSEKVFWMKPYFQTILQNTPSEYYILLSKWNNEKQWLLFRRMFTLHNTYRI